MNRRGFTLLEVIVASSIMAVAVVGLLSSISTSMNGAMRLTEYDRAALVARRKMDELISNPQLSPGGQYQGTLDESQSGGLDGGWSARVTIFEMPPGARPGTPVLQRIELQIWWERLERRRVFTLEGFRRGVLRPGEVPGVPAS
jgi:general secretion pathway protein I